MAHYDLIKVIARSQLDSPDGIGIKRSLYNIEQCVKRKPLYECSRYELNNIIKMSRDDYIRIEAKKQKGHN